MFCIHIVVVDRAEFVKLYANVNGGIRYDFGNCLLRLPDKNGQPTL
jgi:hypothetical protein